MAGNKVTLTFAGDAGSLAKAGKESEQALAGVDGAADKSGKQLSNASKSSTDLGTKMGHLGSAVSGATDAISGIADGVSALNDLQHAGAERASKLAHAQVDVEKAMNDVEQASRDLRSAQLDLNEAQSDGKRAAQDVTEAEHAAQRALLDTEKAQKDYNDAVKEHGKNSYEARDAALALTEANDSYNSSLLDANEAHDDANRAIEDGNQAMQDMTAAATDAKDSTVGLSDAQRALKDSSDPSTLQQWTDKIQLFAPIVTAAVGVIGLLTAAQWLWNASLWASPITWIVAVVIVLIAAIVLIATKTTWFQDLWKWAWGGIKDAAKWAWDGIQAGASAVWSYLTKVWDYFLSIPGKIKSTFASLGEAMFAPFRWAFNKVSDAWNGTIGRLHWSVPGWVPGIGGNSISAPMLPKYHTGGIVSGALGAETLAVLQAGERVTPAGGGHAEDVVTLEFGDSAFDRLVRDSIRRTTGLGGNDPIRILRGNRG